MTFDAIPTEDLVNDLAQKPGWMSPRVTYITQSDLSPS
jgi:hypothetical protein